MYVLMIIIVVLLTMPAYIIAARYMTDEKKNLKIKQEFIGYVPVYIISIILSEIINGILYEGHAILEYSFLERISKSGMMVSLCYILIYIVINMRNKRHGRYHKLRNIWIFLVIFLNEVAAVSRVLALPISDADVTALFIQFVLDIGVYLILFNLLAKEKMAKELEELRYHMEIEKIRYHEMDKEREAMAKLRHDYNNQLTSVLGLLHMKREDEAKELLKEMRSEHYD